MSQSQLQRKGNTQDGSMQQEVLPANRTEYTQPLNNSASRLSEVPKPLITCPCGYPCAGEDALVMHILISHIAKSETEGLTLPQLGNLFNHMQHEPQKRYDYINEVPYGYEQPKPKQVQRIEYHYHSDRKRVFPNVLELLHHLIFDRRILSFKSLGEHVLLCKVLTNVDTTQNEGQKRVELPLLDQPVPLDALPDELSDLTLGEASLLLTELTNYSTLCLNDDLLCLDEMKALEVGHLLPFEPFFDTSKIKHREVSTADNSSGKKKPSGLVSMADGHAKFASPSNQNQPKESKPHKSSNHHSKSGVNGARSPSKDERSAQKHESSKRHSKHHKHHRESKEGKSSKHGDQKLQLLPASQDTKSTTDSHQLGKRSPLPVIQQEVVFSSPKQPGPGPTQILTPQKTSTHFREISAEEAAKQSPAERVSNRPPSYVSKQPSPSKPLMQLMELKVSKEVAEKYRSGSKPKSISGAQSQAGGSVHPSEAKSLPNSEYSRGVKGETPNPPAQTPPQPSLSDHQTPKPQTPTAAAPQPASAHLPADQPVSKPRTVVVPREPTKEFKPEAKKEGGMFSSMSIDALRNISAGAVGPGNLRGLGANGAAKQAAKPTNSNS